MSFSSLGTVSACKQAIARLCIDLFLNQAHLSKHGMKSDTLVLAPFLTAGLHTPLTFRGGNEGLQLFCFCQSLN